MKNITETAIESSPVQLGDAPIADDNSAMKPLSPSKRVELWSGRFAMVGFATTVAAIAMRASI